MDQLEEFLNKFLEIIDYKKDKASFIKRFLDLIKTKTVLVLYDSLPQDKKIDKQLLSKLDQEAVKERLLNLIKENYSEKQILEKSKETTRETTTALLASLKPRLSEKQREQLTALAKEVI